MSPNVSGVLRAVIITATCAVILGAVVALTIPADRVTQLRQ